MKALHVVAGPEGGTFRFNDAPVAEPGPAQARVRVRASGLNRGVVMFLALKRLKRIGVTFRTRTVEEDIACSRRFAGDLLSAFQDGRLRPVLHGSFPWEEIEAAYRSMAEDNHTGKIVATL